MLIYACSPRVGTTHYEEITVDPPTAVSSQQKDSHQLLEEMIQQGQDPHAFLNDSQNLKESLNPSLINSNTGTQNAFQAMAQMPESKEQQELLLASKGEGHFQWQTPKDWIEKPGGGMRLATFTNPNASSIDVSLVSLSGPAGGMLANINRWLQQIDLPVMDQAALDQFLNKQEKFNTESGVSIVLIDFSSLIQAQHSKEAQVPGLMASIIDQPDSTVFIKMTGLLDEVNQNKEAFKQLCWSFRKN